MKKIALMVVVIAVSFFSGYAFRAARTPGLATGMKRATGIGGIFFKCKDPKKVREWYQTHLGLQTNAYGAVFEWRQGADTNKKGFTQWSPFKETTKYFEPGTRDFMINYRVANMDVLVADLRKNGVTILDTIETYDYCKFVHILDIEGNKVELWEPYDDKYEEMGQKMGATTTK